MGMGHGEGSETRGRARRARRGVKGGSRNAERGILFCAQKQRVKPLTVYELNDFNGQSTNNKCETTNENLAKKEN